MKITGSKDTIDWYDSNAEKYCAGGDKVTFENNAKILLGKLKSNPKVLDAGCGDGRDSQTLSSLGATVVGIDLSQGMIELAKKNRHGIQFLHADFLSIPFPDASFDGIWSHASLVHLDTLIEVKQALDEFNRVLKPEGWLYIYVKEQKGSEETAIVSDSLSNHERFFRYFTKEQLSTLLEESGYMVGDVTIVEDFHGRKEILWIRVFAGKISDK
ncbi:MAG: Methylase involved in ubiquinone/menaquinone biosynthesis [Parcubacteria group bacterium GW2011_GWA2_43_11]|nr:MAG: Methylase involved in ubiquinone/menaquinone biosynthesis [Parcubacteria group bacterium GW2011_GWC2_42_11]KKS85828.1 MAG: Methylase involved in ubiquinone/menaquinone biosynthesis [Parcubacteria group bacterium GW2011_GWA2_43_11]